MKLKETLARAFAPIAKKSAEKSTTQCLIGINQPKLPKKLMYTVK